MEYRLIFALVGSLLYWLAWQAIFYDFMEAFTWLPMVHAAIFGAITGRFTEALILGATISALYVSLVNTGGNVPADEPAAGAIAIPIALMSNMDLGSAITLAVTLSVAGNFFGPITFSINQIFVRLADRYAEEGNLKKLKNINFLAMIPVFLMRFTYAFVAIYFGSELVNGVIAKMPEQLANGLNVAGGVLPALGIAATMLVINKTEYIPVFVIGYFMVVVLNISVLVVAIFGICAVLLYLALSAENDKALLNAGEDDDE